MMLVDFFRARVALVTLVQHCMYQFRSFFSWLRSAM